jgi:hypothetical protein
MVGKSPSTSATASLNGSWFPALAVDPRPHGFALAVFAKSDPCCLELTPPQSWLRDYSVCALPLNLRHKVL